MGCKNRSSEGRSEKFGACGARATISLYLPGVTNTILSTAGALMRVHLTVTQAFARNSALLRVSVDWTVS